MATNDKNVKKEKETENENIEIVEEQDEEGQEVETIEGENEVVDDDSPKDKKKDSDSDKKSEELDESEEKEDRRVESFNKEEGLSEEEREAKREARRIRRHKKKEAERKKDALLASQRKQLDEVNARLEAIENRGYNSELAQVENDIDATKNYLDQANKLLGDAIEAGDKERVIKANNAILDARDHLRHLEGVKKQMSAGSRRPANANAAVRQFALAFQKKNQWFNPKSADEDSLIAKAIDNAVARDGFDPSTPEFWEELEARLKRRLPHLYEKKKKKEADYEEEDEIEEEEVEEDDENPAPKRKSILSGSGNKQGGGATKIVLSRHRVEAMKEMGLEPGTKEWTDMAKRYADYDKQKQNKKK